MCSENTSPKALQGGHQWVIKRGAGRRGLFGFNFLVSVWEAALHGTCWVQFRVISAIIAKLYFSVHEFRKILEFLFIFFCNNSRLVL